MEKYRICKEDGSYEETLIQPESGDYVIVNEPDTTNVINTEKYMKQLQDLVTDMRIRAKGAAIGKTGSNSYIIAQQEFYEIKFQQCISLDNSEEIEMLLQNEADEYGIELHEFKDLVIYMYNTAKEKYNLFMRMIERCRTKIQTLIENNNWENVSLAFEIASTIHNVEQAGEVMFQILEL